MAFDLELGSCPNMTLNVYGVGYLLSQVRTDRVMHIEILKTASVEHHTAGLPVQALR